MKKIFFAIPLVALLLTACDPKEVYLGSPDGPYSSEALANGFSFTQYADEAHTQEKADGNYFTYTTSPAEPVIVYQLVNGEQQIIGSGCSGSFKIVPKRGNPTEQTFYVCLANQDGSRCEFEKTVNVYVPSDLTTEMKYLVSDGGQKVWKWDTEWRADGGAWGKMGYCAGDGDSFVNDGNGIWWGGAPEILNTPDQLKNAPNGQPQGDASRKAYMVFNEDGKIVTYDSLGNQLRSGKFTMIGYDGQRHPDVTGNNQQQWSLGTLHTDAGSIMWPFMINGGGTVLPTDFEVLQLDVNHLKLVYAQPGTGSWTEATWWAFKSESDGLGALTNYGSKDWTWDTEYRADGGVWGNYGYAPSDGETFVTTQSAIWWGGKPEDLATPDQLKNSADGQPHGDESSSAYMTIDWKAGTITSFDANGQLIRSGKYELKNWGNGSRTIGSIDGSQSSWSLGKLITAEPAILWPYEINWKDKGHSACPSEFEILRLDGSHLMLSYVAPGTGSWTEATWWAFKKK